MSEALRQVVWKCDRCGGDAQAIFGIFPSCKCGSTSFKAAQPPAPTAQQCTCPSGDGSLRWPCPQHPANIAQPVQQPGAEPDEFLGLPFNEAKTRILALDAESARGMAISFMIQLGLLQKYAAPAQRQPLSDEQIDSLTFQFLTAELGPTAYDRAIARAIEAAHKITAAPAAQKGEKL